MTKYNMTLWAKSVNYPKYKLLSPEHGLCQGHSIGWSPNGRMVFYNHKREELKDMLALHELSGCASMGCAGLLAEWRREQRGIQTPRYAAQSNFGFILSAGSLSFMYGYLGRGMRAFRSAYRAIGFGSETVGFSNVFDDHKKYGKQKILVFSSTKSALDVVRLSIEEDKVPVQLRWCGFHSLARSGEWVALRPVKGWLVLIQFNFIGARILTEIGYSTIQPGPRALMREVSKLIRRFESTSQHPSATSTEALSPCSEPASP